MFSLPVLAQVSLMTDKKTLERARQKNLKLLAAIAECQAHEYRHSGPLISKHPLISKVYGLQKDKSCLYTQSLPHGALKTCHLSAKHRSIIKTQGQKGLNQFMTDPSVCKNSGNNI